jgi:hypothetical protein
MQIPIEPRITQVTDDSSALARPKRPVTPTVAPARANVVANEQEIPAVQASSVLAAPNVTFKRDSNGQIYYIVTDSETGEELRQLPAEEIRKVGEGIAEYLKREQQKQPTHIRVKA